MPTLKKLSVEKPWVLQEVETPRILRKSTHEDGKIVSPRHRPPLTPREDPLHSFLLKTRNPVPETTALLRTP